MKNFIIGTTSFIFPEPVGENCKKLEKLVDEVSIVMFETRSSLLYDEKDLPHWLKELKLSYNIHLPLDLPWHEGPSYVLEIIRRLIDKVLFLSPNSFVLHPPEEKRLFSDLVELMEKKNVSLEKFFIENIKPNSSFPLIFQFVLVF